MQGPITQIPAPNYLPSDIGKSSAVGGIEYGLQPVKTICGLRRKLFFVILAAAIILIIAGLSAGLGVAVSQKSNSNTVTVTAGENSSDENTSARPVDKFTSERESTSNRIPSPDGGSDSASSDNTAPTPSDNTASTTSDTTASTTSDNTASKTSDNTASITGTPPAEATPFEIDTGYLTITFIKYSTDGALCRYFNKIHPVTTVVEPFVYGDTERYWASWSQGGSVVVLTDPATTVTILESDYSATATFAPQAVTNLPAWDFKDVVVPTVFDCEFSGSVQLLFEPTGRIRYIFSVDLPNACSIGGQSVPGGSSCSLYWRLAKIE